MTNPRLFQLRHGGHLLKVRNTTLSVGRRISSDIVLRDPRASRTHARIIVGDNSAAIEDLGSVNGVYLNGKRVQGFAKLKPGDRIGIGRECIDVVGFTEVGSTAEAEAEAEAVTLTGAGVNEVLASMRARK